MHALLAAVPSGDRLDLVLGYVLGLLLGVAALISVIARLWRGLRGTSPPVVPAAGDPPPRLGRSAATPAPAPLTAEPAGAGKKLGLVPKLLFGCIGAAALAVVGLTVLGVVLARFGPKPQPSARPAPRAAAPAARSAPSSAPVAQSSAAPVARSSPAPARPAPAATPALAENVKVEVVSCARAGLTRFGKWEIKLHNGDPYRGIRKLRYRALYLDGARTVVATHEGDLNVSLPPAWHQDVKFTDETQLPGHVSGCDIKIVAAS